MLNFFNTLWQGIDGQTVSILLFFVGIYGLLARRNIIKSILSFAIIQGAIVLFFSSINATEDSVAPIGERFSAVPSDPLPHALMITNIIIGASVIAVALTMFITLYHKYGTTNWSKVRKKRGQSQ